MVASILRAQAGHSALSTQGNLNNDIGVPLTVLNLRAHHTLAVVELGMNHPGEIAWLSRIAQPTVALVNNAQREHQEFMGTVQAVAEENGAVLGALPADGVAVFPADEAYSGLWAGLAGSRATSRFALQGADVSAAVVLWQTGAWQFTLKTPQGTAPVRLHIAGRHNVKNALAAAACALAAGVPLTAVVQGLQAFEPVKGRSRALSLRGGAVSLVDDTYNANPDSVRAAIDVLAELPAPRLLVLGDMGEVGNQGPQFHAEVGSYAAERGIDALYTLGDLSVHADQAFGRGVHFADMAALQAEVVAHWTDFASIVVKGSRFMKMERVVETWCNKKKQRKGGRMLLSLAQWLQGMFPEWGFLRVFQYITFRAVMAAMTALLIGLAAGPAVIRHLTSLKIGQPIRGYGMESHLSKSGTPTMGGVLILLAIAIATLLWFDLSNRFVWIVLIVTLGFGAIGWVDDWRKVVNKDPEGMRSREKYFWQSVIGLLAALYLVFSISESSNLKVLDLFVKWVLSGFDVNLPPKAGLQLPFFKEINYPLGVFGFVLMTYLVIVGASNAVNLTDGLDGLAIMPVVMVGSALGVFAYVTGSAVYSKYLFFPHIPGSGELLIFCAAMAGAGLAFLWFNTHPAQVFMGDVGALALGGALGTIAVIVRQEIVLAIMGGVFVVEALSVMAQVTYFKYTKKKYGEGRRILKMAPLHHHFEKSGWKETQVVVRFWIITMLLCLVGLSTLKLR